MTMKDHGFIGSLMTQLLVGRTVEQAAIREAISPEVKDSFALLIFIADGGIGKTRLLRETARQLDAIPEKDDPLRQFHFDRTPSWPNDGVLCLQLIDVADPRMQDQIGFLRAAREMFSNMDALSSQIIFERMDQAWREYEELRDTALSYQDIQAKRQELVEAFTADYADITQHYRVVWLVDTLEQLFGFDVQTQGLLTEVGITEEHIRQTTYSWLLHFIGREPKNTTILLAGRPSPPRWLVDLRKLPKAASFREFQVGPFSEAETQEYFAALLEQIDIPSYADVAEYVKLMIADEERSAVLHLLTEGNPILLALYIDMLTSVPQDLDELDVSLAELKNLGAKEIATRRAAVEQKLIENIELGLKSPSQEVLQFLFVTRRGLNARRLQKVWENSEIDLTEVLRHLRNLSFVKGRELKVYLHDELYAMYARTLVNRTPEEREVRQKEVERIYHAIIDYCSEAIEENTAQIAQLDEKELQRATLSEEQRKKLSEFRQNRRRYKAERLHYQLYLDPERGFHQDYYTLAEEAFLAADFDLDTYIQVEIDIFFFGPTANLSQQLTGMSNPDWQILQLEVAVERAGRWIQRLRRFNQLEAAQQFATLLLAKLDQVFAQYLSIPHPEPQFWQRFNAEVQAYRSFAAILQGQQMTDALEALRMAIQQLEQVLRQGLRSPAARMRILNIVAQCFAENGYGYATLGNFRLAQSCYERAERILRVTQQAALIAEVKNNFSRIIGELGNYNRAEQYCQEALALREQLGFDHAVALSLSTLSLIRSRNTFPVKATRPAQEALRMFTQLNSPRGVMLASLQLAEAKRRTWKIRPAFDQLSLLAEAEQILLDVEKLFDSKQVQEISRQITLYIELGCMYRERSAFEFGQNDLRWRKTLDQAVAAFQHARQLAGNEYVQGALDATVNLGYAYFYCHEYAQASEWVNQALAITPAEYLATPERAINIDQAINLALFRHLSKAYGLKLELAQQAKASFREILEYAIFSVTYMDLFSVDPENPHHYLLQNAGEFEALLRRSGVPVLEITRLSDELIATYQLDQLGIHFLRVRKVLKHLPDPDVDLDYL